MSLQLLTILTAAAGMALVALTHNAYPVYFMFAALSAVVLLSYVCSKLSPRALACRRQVADRVFANEPFKVIVELANRARLPRFLLMARDVLPTFVESDQTLELVLPALWPRERVTLNYQARARKRGVYSLGPLYLSTADPFGLFQRAWPFETNTEVLVYPRPLPLRGDLGRTGLEPSATVMGERTVASQSSIEYYGLREYQAGDELRRIHWPATAHHSRLMVIEFDRGGAESLVVVLDTRRGTEFGSGVDTSLETGVTAAASLIHWALSNEGTAGLVVDSARGPLWLAVDSPEREHHLLEMLARVQADGTMAISALLEWAAPRLPPGTATCVITAAPDERLPHAVASLAARQGQTAVLLVDAHSFDSRAFHPAGRSPEVMRALAAAGAATGAVRRGEDLAEALRRLLIGG